MSDLPWATHYSGAVSERLPAGADAAPDGRDVPGPVGPDELGPDDPDDLVPAGRGRRSPAGRRRRAAVQFAVLCVVAAAAGLAGSRFVLSPAEQAARTAPPPPTLLTAPVRLQVLTGTVIARGTVVAGGEVSAQPTAELGASRLVISAKKASPGEEVRPGMVVAEVSGRPVVVLAGRVPAYRDLRLGDTGNDVAELQAALADAGFGSGADSLGDFGKGTRAAVAALYAFLGYSVPGGVKQAYMPMAELLYVPAFPARILQLTSALGAPVAGPVVTVSYGPLRVTVPIDPSDAGIIRRGTPATLTSGTSGASVRAVVTSVGSNASSAGVPVTIAPRGQLPPSWIGQDVQVTIVSARTSHAVLLVPISAVSSTASGKVTVTVVGHGGRLQVVQVIAGASSSGFVAIQPVVAGQLAAGEQVAVGVR